jgi:hypothetical protein
MRLAKAVPGLAGLAREAGRAASAVRSRAHDLAFLAFWQDGVLAPLKHMAERGSSAEDIAEMAAWQARTAEEVARASDRLRRARADLVATQFGMDLAQELDSVVYEKLGPAAIRRRLERIAATGRARARANPGGGCLKNQLGVIYLQPVPGKQIGGPAGASTAGLVRGAKVERSEQKPIMRVMLNHLAIFNGVITILLAKAMLLALPMDTILLLVLGAVLSASCDLGRREPGIKPQVDHREYFPTLTLLSDSNHIYPRHFHPNLNQAGDA